MFRKIALVSVFLALIALATESYSRLSGAMLSCPDWPTCYGQFFVGNAEIFKSQAIATFPAQIIDTTLVLKEFCHRYMQAILSLFILVLSLISWREKHCRFMAVMATLGLLFLLGLQVTSAFWVIKLDGMPIVVTVKILLGMMSFWLLYWMYLRTEPDLLELKDKKNLLTGFSRLAMLVLTLQILLGSWVSANHAGLVCTGFPQCNDQWIPVADYQNALNLLNGLSTGYTGDLGFDQQVAINWLHRALAFVCFIILTLLMLKALSANSTKSLRKAGLWLSILLFIQISLGAIGFKLGMPVWITVAHNAVAALLMLPLLAISFYSRYGVTEALAPAIDREAQPEAFEKARVIKPAEPTFTPAPSPVEVPYVEPAPESLFLRLKSQLNRTRSGLSGAMTNLLLGQKQINKDLLEELEANLLMADIGVNVTTEIIKQLTESLERNQLQDGAALSAALKQQLLAILQPCSQPLVIPKSDKPFVILVVGVNGAGKTTTIGKLAKRLQAQGKSVMLAAGDTFRAAAVEQLQTWGERNNIHVVAQHTGADSASVIYDGVQSAQAKGIDVLIADTAGRLHTKSNLMDELKKVKRIMGKLDETAPHEVLLVLDAGTGQNALSQAKLFNETVTLTGLVLTKLDGTAKGGVIFALAKQAGIPIRFIGIGEGIDDLQDFDAETFVDALFVKD